jgi:endothelin-converting enzyme
MRSSVLTSNEDANVWPPFPWPPWGGDDDDDDDKPVNKTFEAHRLAKEVVVFERKLAQASLDLYVVTFRFCHDRY